MDSNPPDLDRYEAFYTEKVWGLVPEVYRALDASVPGAPGALRELCARIGREAAIVRRSIDRVWEDQSIETCDDWVIPYIGDLLATRLVSGLDARGQRLDVANTIDYRRRKGTLAVLEQVASDLSGWDVRVIEMFRHLARAPHGLDPAPRVEERGTPRGGVADLRDPDIASRAGSAFDRFAYTPDFRRGANRTGVHQIRTLAVHVYRRKALSVDKSTPVQDSACPNQWTFDPTGRDIPLHAASSRRTGALGAFAPEHALAGPIDAALLRSAKEALCAAIVAPTGAMDPRSLRLYEHGASFDLVPAADITADPRESAPRFLVVPERGRVFVQSGEAPALHVGYHHGLASAIGAGGFPRSWSAAAASGPAPEVLVSGDADLGAVLSGLPPSATVTFADSRTRSTLVNVGVAHVVLRAASGARPVVRRTTETDWVFTGSPGAKLAIDGLWVCGAHVVLAGDFSEVTLTSCTLDPGEMNADLSGFALAADGAMLFPSLLRIEGHVGKLTVERSILGPLATVGNGTVETVTISDSVVQGIASNDGGIDAISLKSGLTELLRTTVLGRTIAHRLSADHVILHDHAEVTDRQQGCVRYSAVTEGSLLPRQHRSVSAPPRAPWFVSRRFGDPGYAALHDGVDASVSAGGEGGAEMGVYAREQFGIKEQSIRTKLGEHMPVGLTAVIRHVT